MNSKDRSPKNQIWRSGIFPFFLVLGSGFLISTLPHWIAFFKTSSLSWVADTDELLLYLSFAAKAFHHRVFSLSDPVFSTPHPAFYPWLQIFPGAFIAFVLGLGPSEISFIWRSFSGISIALGWFFIFHHYFKNRWLIAGLSIFLLGESSLLEGKFFFRQLGLILDIVLRKSSLWFEGIPILHPEWRIITPGLSWFFLLLYVGLVLRACKKPRFMRIFLASLSLGLLFHIYFYFWTAALLGLAIISLLDWKNRKPYLFIAGLGSFFGLPFLINHYLFKVSTSDNWLKRSDLFLEVGRFDDLILPKIGPALLLITFFSIRNRKKDLGFLWANALAGLLLLNHQVLTCLQIQNFHWNYYWGPFLAILVLVLVAERAMKWNIQTPWIKGLIFSCLVLFQFTGGLWLRAQEVIQSGLPQKLNQWRILYQNQRLKNEVLPLQKNSVAGGEESFIGWASIFEDLRPLDSYAVVLSPSVTDLEWNDRIALNGILLGHSLQQFTESQMQLLNKMRWGPTARSPFIQNQVLQARIQSYSKILKNLDQTLDRFQVRYVALDAKGGRPEYLKSGWTCLQEGPYWQIWSRNLQYRFFSNKKTLFSKDPLG